MRGVAGTSTRKPCKRCGGEKGPGARRQLCDTCQGVSTNHRRKLAGYHRQQSYIDNCREARLRRTYGISSEQYDEMLERQAGKCAVCRRDPTTQRLSVDHDHQSGRVRGLLCQNCNRAMGWLGDDPELLRAAMEYLRGS